MSKKLLISIACGLTALGVFSSVAWAKASDLRAFTDTYGLDGTRLDTCVLCHGSSFTQFNPYGSAYLQALGATGGDELMAFAMIADLDSDGDGPTNIMEIAMLTFPGNPGDPPAATSTPLPTSPAPSATAEPTGGPTAVPTDSPPQATPTSDSTEPVPTPTNSGPVSPTPILDDEVVSNLVDLVRRKAWADPHKLELPKDSGTPISLYGKVENKGTASTGAEVRFVISEGATGAQLSEFVTEAVVLAPGEIMDLASEWPNPTPGRFQVVAQAWYDSNADGVPDTPGPTIKRFKLDIKMKGTVDLAGKKAWVEDEDFDPAQGSGVLTLFATVENSGMSAARVVVRFQITGQQDGNPILELMTDEVQLEPGQVMDLSADWVAPPLGEFSVLATVWYDSDGDGSLDATGKHVKEFEVEIGSEGHEDEEDEDGLDNKHKKDDEVGDED
jgi:hypothetical protein